MNIYIKLGNILMRSKSKKYSIHYLNVQVRRLLKHRICFYRLTVRAIGAFAANC